MQIINTSTSQILNVLSVIDSNIIIGGDNGYIAKSNDECNNLSFINPPPVLLGDWCEIHRVDTNTIFAFSLSGTYTIIYKSTDNGNSWVQKLNTDSIIGKQFAMFDSLQGILLCFQYTSLHTYDGGNSWIKEPSPFLEPSPVGTFGDSTIICGDQNVAISKDRGHTWVASSSVFPGGSYQRNFYFGNSDTVFCVADYAAGQYMSFSVNAGVNWKHRYFLSPYNIDPYDLYFFNINEGYVVGWDGNSGVIYKTVDTGLTWSVYDTQIPHTLTKIEFLNDSIALIAGTIGTLIKWNKNSYATEIINVDKLDSKISICPNPTSGTQTISFKTRNKNEIININLVDITGETLKNIYSGKNFSSNFKIQSDISELCNGIYFYKIQVGDETYHSKIIKQ